MYSSIILMTNIYERMRKNKTLNNSIQYYYNVTSVITELAPNIQNNETNRIMRTQVNKYIMAIMQPQHEQIWLKIHVHEYRK